MPFNCSSILQANLNQQYSGKYENSNGNLLIIYADYYNGKNIIENKNVHVHEKLVKKLDDRKSDAENHIEKIC